MLEKVKGLINKTYTIINNRLDGIILKARMAEFDDLEKYAVDYVEEDENQGGPGWLDKKGPIGFDFLYDLSSSSIFTAISLRRVNEIASFAHPQKNKYDAGFIICKRDEKAEASEKEQKEMNELVEFVYNTGIEQGREKITKHPRNFEEWIRLSARDRLNYNQVGLERVFTEYQEKDKDPVLHSFYHVPSHSLRYAMETDNKKKQKEIKEALKDNIQYKDNADAVALQKKIKKDDVYCVQVYKERIINVFDDKELLLKQGNLNAELDNNGYARGELELSVNLISSHVFSETHNKLFFTQGFSNKGILVIKNAMNRKVMNKFKQQFRQQMQGTANAFRVPILSGTEIQWVPLQANLKDMEWEKWMNYLIKLICAIFQMSPQEINFDISREGGAGLGDGGNRQNVILSHFKETGIRPLLRWFEGIVNREIIRYYNEEFYQKYMFRFVGFDIEEEKEEVDRLIKEVGTYKTVNEVRKERDLEELDPDMGNVILNQVWLQAQQMSQMEGSEGGGQNNNSGYDSSSFADEKKEPKSGSDGEQNKETKDVLSQDKNKAEKTVKKAIKLHKIEWYGEE